MKLDDDLHWYCPNCNNNDELEMQVMRRTCGYIGFKYVGVKERTTRNWRQSITFIGDD